MPASFYVFLVFIAVMCFIHLYYGLAEYISIQEDRAWWALHHWRQANPDYYIGDWPYAQELVIHRIIAHEIWLAFNSIERDEDHINWLIRLISETLPPSPPRRRRKLSSKSNGPKSWAVFSYQKIPTDRDFVF